MYKKILIISSTDAPAPDRSLLSLSSFSIIRMKFRKARLMKKVKSNSFNIDLWIIFMIDIQILYHNVYYL
jgi:ribosomal protein L39E